MSSLRPHDLAPSNPPGSQPWQLFYWSMVILLFAWATWQRFALPLDPIVDPDTWGYLSPALRNVAAMLDISLVDVYGVATYFRSFSLEPKGKHVVTCCLGTACHVRNAGGVLGEAKRHLGIEAGETTEDMLFSLETVNCLGACAMGPIVVVDGDYHAEMTPAKVKKVLKKVADEEGRG